MATYDIDNLPARLQDGDIVNCPYKGSIKSITLPKGQYKLECWGARGGYHWLKPEYSGIGGYSCGVYSPTSKETLYLVCGGNGMSRTAQGVPPGNTVFTGGFNGGGDGYSTLGFSCGTGGGGATHIAKISGELKTLSSSINSILLVAGGGAGSVVSGSGTSIYGYYTGGSGGGLSGVAGEDAESSMGTQSSGGTPRSATYSTSGSFGQGGSYTSTSLYMNSGGGGGFYGGAGGAYRGSGGAGGGSGYISANLSDASTQVETTSTNPDTTNYAGYIRITVIKAPSGGKASLVINRELVEAKRIYVKIGGTWIWATETYVKINNTWKESS